METPSLASLRDAFQTIYLPARNYAPLTRRTYGDRVVHFIAWCTHAGITSPRTIELSTLNAYLAYLDGRGLAGATRRKDVYALKLFFGFLVSHRHVSQNVALGMVPPVLERMEPRVLSVAEYTRLRDAVRDHARDAAIVEVLLQTGLLLSELAHLRLDDLAIPQKIGVAAEDAGALTVRQSTGRRDRTITLNYRACEALAAYLQERPADVPYREVFLSKHRTPLKTRAYQAMLDRTFARAGIDRAHVHTLRHTCATHLVKAGADLHSVQELLGHANIDITRRYVRLARVQMDREMQVHAL